VSIDWEQVENAMYDWVSRSSGLTTIWANQGGDLPPSPYCLMNLTSVNRLGAVPNIAFEEFEDGLQATATNNNELVFSIQAFSDDMTNSRSAPNKIGSFNAIAILNRVRAYIRLPSFQGALQAAGVYPAYTDSVRNLSTLVKVAYVSRAQFDAHFYCQESVSELIGYIKHVRATLVLPDETIDLAADAP
jgi:hypothetical protein